MKKRTKIVLTVVIVLIAVTSVAIASGAKGFPPYKTPVDAENLPKEIKAEEIEETKEEPEEVAEIAEEPAEREVNLDPFVSLYANLMDKSVDKLEGDEKQEGSKLAEVYKEKLEKAETVDEIKLVFIDFKEDLRKIDISPVTTAVNAEEEKKEEISEEAENAASTNNPETNAYSDANTPSPTYTAPTEPPHEHTWKHVDATYKTVHHDAVYENVWVEDKPAWEESVLVKEAWDEVITETEYITEEYILTGDGYEFPNVEAYNDWRMSLSDEEIPTFANNYTIRDRVTPVETQKNIHHDAIYETVLHEAEGHYESKQTQAAYDEQVLETAAYDICTGCGATK